MSDLPTTCLCGWVVDMVPVFRHGWFLKWITLPCLACTICPQLVCEECSTSEPWQFAEDNIEGRDYDRRCAGCGVPLCRNCMGWSMLYGHEGHCRSCAREFCEECQRHDAVLIEETNGKEDHDRSRGDGSLLEG